MPFRSKAGSFLVTLILACCTSQLSAQTDSQLPGEVLPLATSSLAPQDSNSPKTNSQDSDGGDPATSTDVKLSTTDEDAEPGEEGKEKRVPPLLTNDAVIFGILMLMLGFVFWSSNSKYKPFKLFYSVIPMLLMCYFLPSLLTLFNVVDAKTSNLYFIATRYMLPASLILLTLSIDLSEIFKLGPKALIMFFTGTVGVVLGGPLAILIVSSFAPSWVGGVEPNEVWRGMTTIAGAWIGGGANQVAMKEVFGVTELYSAMVAIDVLVAEFWMMFLLIGVGKADAIDRFLKADSSSIERLNRKM